MRAWDLTGASAKLEGALKALHAAEKEALTGWDDRVSRTMREKYLEILESRTKKALDAIHHLTQVLGSAQRACDSES